MKATATGFRRILNAFTYSYDGLKAVWKTEVAFRQDVLFCILAGIALYFLPGSSVEKALMSLTLMLIITMEAINSAIESVIDRISPDYHDLSKKAKDIGSLLVLLAFISVVLVWGVILIPYFL